jgi:hypothetical protein
MKNLLITLVLIAVIYLPGCSRYKDLDLSMYQYRDTKDLVKFVYDAASMLEEGGTNSLEDFRNNRARYNTKDYYLYIYDMHGTNIYSAGMKHLEGKNLWDVTDKNGKKITQLVLAALEDKNNPHGWVHYSWWQPGKFYPVPKSSCHFKVHLPDGKEMYVGGGLNYPHEEKEFVRIIVDSAVQLINKEGKSAFAKISDPTSEYNYRDVQVFAFQKNGKIIISPVTDDSLSQIDLLTCVDEVGHKPFAEALKKLESKERVWEVFMAKNKYKRELVKKSLYLRKVMLNGETIYVGAISDLPQPS